MDGLNLVVQRCFGVQMVPAPVCENELWHPDLRKLHVVDDEHGVIGTIYCDFFPRAGKDARGPAQYTIQVGQSELNQQPVAVVVRPGLMLI